MQPWLRDMSRGKRALRHHRPLLAVREFQRAINGFPEERDHVPHAGGRRRELAILHYYLALSLRKAGARNRALSEFVQAASLTKRGFARRKLHTQTNGYGMARQSSPHLDDRHAFYGVQLSRYLRSKRSHRLGTRAEVDMVMELVEEHWKQLSETGGLEALAHDQRLARFREVVIVFPFLSVPEEMKTDDLAVDFWHGKRVGREDRCPCGSALPYKLCHGRPPGIDEVLNGKF